MESQKQTSSISLPFEISNFKSAILGYCAHLRLYFTPSWRRSTLRFPATRLFSLLGPFPRGSTAERLRLQNGRIKGVPAPQPRLHRLQPNRPLQKHSRAANFYGQYCLTSLKLVVYSV